MVGRHIRSRQDKTVLEAVEVSSPFYTLLRRAHDAFCLDHMAAREYAARALSSQDSIRSSDKLHFTLSERYSNLARSDRNRFLDTVCQHGSGRDAISLILPDWDKQQLEQSSHDKGVWVRSRYKHHHPSSCCFCRSISLTIVKYYQRLPPAPSFTGHTGKFTIICLMLNHTIVTGIFARPCTTLPQANESSALAVFLGAVGSLLMLATAICWAEMNLSLPSRPLVDLDKSSRRGWQRVSATRSGGDKSYVSVSAPNSDDLLSAS